VSGGDRARPLRVASVMFTLELLRRWPTLVFMIAMPTAYFLVSYLTSDAAATVQVPIRASSGTTLLTVSDRDIKALYLAILGLGVTSSFAAMASLRGNLAANRRLRLIGYWAAHLLWARLFVLLGVVIASTLVFLAIYLPLVSVHSPLLTAAALLMIGVVGVGLGAMVGLLVPREFEAAMVVVAVAGVQMALGRGDSSADRFLPYWPAIEAAKSATFTSDTSAAIWWLLGLEGLYGLVFFTVAGLVWTLRTRVGNAGSGPGRRGGRDDGSASARKPARNQHGGRRRPAGLRRI
jgi:hypothetical protein